jgi:hypothetical protein
MAITVVFAHLMEEHGKLESEPDQGDDNKDAKFDEAGPKKSDTGLMQIEERNTGAYSKDNQYICAFMSKIVSVFKDIAQLNPLFRDQITNFSINQVAANVFESESWI